MCQFRPRNLCTPESGPTLDRIPAKSAHMRAFARPLALVAALLAAAPAAAQERSPSFALKAIGAGDQGYYSFPGEPGATVSGRIMVINTGPRAGTVRLDAVDATTGATTGAVYRDVEERAEGVGAWISLSRASVELEPGGEAVVPFTVTVPGDARRGDHLGGIVAVPVSEEATGENGGEDRSFRVEVVNQSIVAVQLEVPGAARSLLAVRGVEPGGNPGYQTLELALSNPGEKMVKGKGTVEIVRGGDVVAGQDFAIDTFLPRTRIAYPLVMRDAALEPGDYSARIKLDWDGGDTTEELAFTVSRRNIEQAFGEEGVAALPGGEDDGGSGVLPVVLAVLLALLIGVVFAVLHFRRQARRLEARLHAQRERDDEPRFTQGERESRPASRVEPRGDPRRRR